MFRLFPWQKGAKHFFSADEEKRIVDAIREMEVRTSGELRVFIESRCKFMNAIDRAAELFFGLKMDETKDENGVLLYVALKDRQLAVFGDRGIHEKVGSDYWKREVSQMLEAFNKEDYAAGISQCIYDIGEALYQHFPYDEQTDKNELPDNIVFGR